MQGLGQTLASEGQARASYMDIATMQGSSLQGALDRRSEKVLGVRLTRSDELCGAATPSVTVRLEADPRHCRDLVRAPADSSMAEADHGLPARAAEAAAALAAERPSVRAPSPMPGAVRCVSCCSGRCRLSSQHRIIALLHAWQTLAGLLAGVSINKAL